MKTERLTLLLKPSDKRAIAARAKKEGVSASEYVRRAIDAYDLENIDERDVPEDVLAALSDLARATERTEKALNEAEEASRLYHEHFARQDEMREEIRKELLRSGERWPWPIPGGGISRQ
jgi:hypothetical protein